MAYLLSGDGRNTDVEAAFRRYRHYLASVQDRFPRSAYALAVSEWYFDPRDRRCPHDAWLETLSLSEPSSGTRREQRSSALTIRLLGAYHDGHIELHYRDLIGYRLTDSDVLRGHGDWHYDELRLSEEGHLLHEIEWHGRSGTTTWLIEAADLELRWHPKDDEAASPLSLLRQRFGTKQEVCGWTRADFLHTASTTVDALVNSVLFAPSFVEIEGLVFVADLGPGSAGPTDGLAEAIRAARAESPIALKRLLDSCNWFEVPYLFAGGEGSDEEDAILAHVIADAWRVRLRGLYPERRFEVRVIPASETGSTIGVGFREVFW